MYKNRRFDLAVDPAREQWDELRGSARVVIYARISDDRREGAGVERQLSECRAYAAHNGWQVDREFVDNDLSATSGVLRPAFEEMLDYRPDRIVVWHTDRLVRKTNDLERVIDLGVPVNAITAGHLDLSTPAGQAVARTVTAWATYEGQQKALRQVAANRQRAASGKPAMGSNRPYGYMSNGELVETEAAHLRHGFAMIKDGASFADVARYLTAQGETTPKGNAWNSRNVRQVMVNDRNGGMRTYKGKVVSVDGQWQPIIPRHEYQAIIEKATRPEGAQKGRNKARSLLAGLIRCGVCGGRVVRGTRSDRRKGHEGERVYLYRCEDKACVSSPADFLDDLVVKIFARWITSPAYALRQGERVATGGDNSASATAAGEAADARVRLAQLQDAFTAGEVSLAVFTPTAARLEATIADLDREASSFFAARTALDDAQSPATFLKGWRDGEVAVADQRAVLAQHIERVVILRRPRGSTMTKDYVQIIMRDAPRKYSLNPK